MYTEDKKLYAFISSKIDKLEYSKSEQAPIDTSLLWIYHNNIKVYNKCITAAGEFCPAAMFSPAD